MGSSIKDFHTKGREVRPNADKSGQGEGKFLLYFADCGRLLWMTPIVSVGEQTGKHPSWNILACKWFSASRAFLMADCPFIFVTPECLSYSYVICPVGDSRRPVLPTLRS